MKPLNPVAVIIASCKAWCKAIYAYVLAVLQGAKRNSFPSPFGRGVRGEALLFLFLLVTSISYSQTVTESISYTTYTAAGTYTITIPNNVTSVLVQCWGAGGAGGGGGGTDGGCGGGGGAYAIKEVAVTPGDSYELQVGEGGDGVANGTGEDGTDSWFSSSTEVRANGGKGGATNGGAVGAGGTDAGLGDDGYAGGAGGEGGTAQGAGGGSSASKNTTGNAGADGNGTPGATAPQGGGNGGDGENTNGSVGVAPGGGGGGAGDGGTRTGGAGADGKVLITYNKFTAPAAAAHTRVFVKAWGGGGGGGADDGGNGGSGGGGGAYGSALLAVVPSTEYELYVGEGGYFGIQNTGGADSDGDDGGDSWFASSTTSLLANGGGGGEGAQGAAGAGGTDSGVGSDRSIGGTGGVGAANAGSGGGSSASYDGEAGVNGTVSTTGATAPAGGGDGGDGHSTGSGLDGSVPGGGGGGGDDSDDDGGSGGHGKIEIYYDELLFMDENSIAIDNNIQASETDKVIHSFSLTAYNDADGVNDVNVTGLGWTTTGTYVAGDISQFELWWDTDATFAGATVLDNVAGAGPGAQAAFAFNEDFTNATTYYFFITMDVDATITDCGTIAVAGMSTDNNSITATIDGGDVDAFGTVSAGSAHAFNCPAPGGVAGGLKIWLKADAGITTSGSDVTAWVNQGGAGETFTNQDADEPVYDADDATANFNPSLTTINANGGMEYSSARNEIFSEYSPIMCFYMVNKTSTNLGTACQMGSFDWPSFEVNYLGTANEFGIALDDTDFETTGQHSTATISSNENTIITSGFNNDATSATSGKLVNYKNGALKEEKTSTSDGAEPIGNHAATYIISIGANEDGTAAAPSQTIDGIMPEIIIYNTYDLTANEIQRINSYLAIKYGVTLDQSAADLDYLAADGTVVWDASANTTYKNDIAGIGRDDDQALSQIKSKSQSSDGILTVHAANEGTSNAIGDITWSAMADKEFFMWGNDGGAITMTTTNAPADCKKITRTWYVQESADVGTLTFTFDVDDADFNVPALTCGATSYVLMYDTDADLDGGTVVKLYDDGATAGDVTGSDGVWTNNTINMATGTFFSIGQVDEQTWTGDGADNNWSTDDNWLYNVAPVEGNALVFAGTTRLTPVNDYAADTDFASISFDLGAGAFVLSGADIEITGGGCTTGDASTGNHTSNTIEIQNNITYKTNAPTITTTAGGTLNFSGTIDNGGLNITNACGGTSTFSGVISGGGTFIKNGAGALTLSATNTMTGGVTLNAGTLNIADAQALGTVAGTFAITGGTFDNTTGGALSTLNYPQTWNGNFTFTGTDNLDLGTGAVTIGGASQITTSTAGKTLTVDGIISGGFLLTKAGAGTLTLGGNNTMTGGVTLSAGVLQIEHANALGAVAGTLTLAGGTIDNTSGGALNTPNYPQTWSGDFTFTGTDDLDLGTGAVTMSAARQVTASASNLTVGGVISGGFSLTKLGGGTLTLEGTNTFTGGVTLSAGTLNIEAAQALGTSAGTFTIADGTTINATSGAIDMSATDNPIAINGNFTFTGSNNLDLGDGAITMGASRSITTSANTLTMGGVLTAATSTLTSAGAGGLSFVSQAVTLSGLVISAGTLTSTSGNLSLAGDFDNDATFAHNNGTVTFNGAVDQNLGTSAGTQTFYDLVIATTASGNDVTLNDPVTLVNDLTLTTGIIFTSATNLLTATNTSADALPSGDADSYIDGPVAWAMNNAAESYVFPTGDGGSWARIGVEDLTNAVTFTAEYKREDYGDATLDGVTPPNNVSNIEYWILTQSGASTADISLFWEDDDFSGIDECAADLTVAHFDGTDWDDVGNAGGFDDATCTDGGWVKANAVSTFSPFTFGSKGGANNPLPIELLSFDAVYNGTAVDLTWVTATEINNNYFTIERSTNGVDFKEIANVPSKGLNGNSTTTLNYYEVDPDVTSGVYYYRLKQTDFDGTFTYSQVEQVVIHDEDEFEFNISPNPSGGQTIAALINANAGDEVALTIIDMLGQFIFNFDIKVEQDDAELYPITFPEQLAPGVYIISAQIGDKAITRRMVID